jgi:hypothetical protein
VLWWAIHEFGIAGAAAAWTLRVVVDAVALYWSASSLMPEVRKECGYAMAWILFGGTSLGAFLSFEQEMRAMASTSMVLVVLVLLTGFIWAGWHLRRLWSSMK